MGKMVSRMRRMRVSYAWGCPAVPPDFQADNNDNWFVMRNSQFSGSSPARQAFGSAQRGERTAAALKPPSHALAIRIEMAEKLSIVFWR